MNSFLTQLQIIIGKIRNWIADKSFVLRDSVQHNRIHDLCLVLTLILLLLYAEKSWYTQVPTTILSLIGLIYTKIRSSRTFWYIIMVFVIVGCYFNKFVIDNHKYLLAYWCIAIFCAKESKNPNKILAFNARILIGLTFLYASFSKIISSDYLNSEFFHFALLSDSRFSSLAIFFGNITPQIFEFNTAAFVALNSYDSVLMLAQLQSTSEALVLSKFLTWWGLVFEVCIAISFLCPLKNFISQLRDYLLLGFVLTTYAIATVTGFGWVLIIMGISQSDAIQNNIRLSYLLAFIILQAYQSPWSKILGVY